MSKKEKESLAKEHIFLWKLRHLQIPHSCCYDISVEQMGKLNATVVPLPRLLVISMVP